MGMKWWKLKTHQCPRCGKDLHIQDIGYWKCNNCQYGISESRKQEIVANMQRQELDGILERANQAQKEEDAYWDGDDVL